MKRVILAAALIGMAGVAAVLAVGLDTMSSREAAAMLETTAGTTIIDSSLSTISDARVDSAADVDATTGEELAIQGIDTEESSILMASSVISLNRTEVSVAGTDVPVDGSVVTITTPGTYTIQGELADGRIVVDVSNESDVTLILSNATLRCSDFAPIYVANAGNVVIVLADGTQNYVEDGATYILEAGTDEPDAAIFSHDDLTVTGSGSLTVVANYNDGIQSKDDLVIESGDITVTAANDGLKGRDSITILDADLTIDAGGDGLQSNGTEAATQGVVVIEGGTFTIEAGADGIQAASTLVINDGSFDLVTGGGSSNSSATSGWGSWGTQSTTVSASAKGLKAGSSLAINGGTIEIDSSDDAIHSNDTLVINDGEIVIYSGDDGIHADTSLAINDGDVTINKSYEGIESMDLALNGGTIYVVASDDGINGAGGNDGSAIDGRPGQNMFSESTNCTMTIRGGYIYVDAVGDGLDVNGPITMTGGTVVLHAPTDDRDGALDWTGSFNISGGYLIAAGSYGRTTQAPSSTSSQNSVMINLDSAVSSGTLIHIEDANGNTIATFEPAKTWQSFLLSSSALESGETYNVYVGGSASGSSTDGLYSGGTYSAGTSVGSFSVSNAVTVLGSQTMTAVPPPPGGGRP